MKLPPFNALRVFEAAARQKSFLKASEELHVTPGAVSRQVKLLEDYLGVTLFHRGHRQVELIDVYRPYYEQVSKTLSELAAATNDLRRDPNEKVLRLWCARSFMRQWLIPRLASFKQLHPDLDIEFETFARRNEIRYDTLNFGILLSQDPLPGYACQPMFGVELIPICSPDYLRSTPAISSADDLRRHTIIESANRPQDWQAWQKQAGLDDLGPAKIISFKGESLAYQAALEGAGIALGRRKLCEMDVRAGRLVCPLDLAATSPDRYFLLRREGIAPNAAFNAFRRWLLDQIAEV